MVGWWDCGVVGWWDGGMVGWRVFLVMDFLGGVRGEGERDGWVVEDVGRWGGIGAGMGGIRGIGLGRGRRGYRGGGENII